MGIKNWTTKTKQIKRGESGISDHSRYLLSNDEQAHEKTNIIHLGGSPDAIIGQYEARRRDRQEKGLRGGGVRNLATSFVMSLPKDIGHPTPEQWKSILKPVFVKLAQATDLDPKDLAKSCFAVVHDESQSGKQSHCHLLVSNIINKEHQKKITQRIATQAVKDGFNIGVRNTLKIDHRNYKPERTGVKDKDIWLYRKEKAEEEKNAAISERKRTNEQGRLLQKVGKVFKSYGNTLAKWFETQDEKTEQILIKKMQRQISASIEYGATEEMLEQFKTANKEAEDRKKKKTGLNFPKPPAP